MIGALNKLFRKTASLKGKDIYDKRLIKASYSGDMKEPKEKHVLFILECIKGKHLELIRPKEALRKVSERFFNNLKSLSLMVKTLIILHRALQEEDISQTVAHKIKEMENILQPCQNDDQSYDLKMQCFISDLYINYIKNLINFIIISQLFQISLKDLHHYSRSLQLIELFLIFTRIDTLIECIVKVFEQKAYCQHYRLFHSVVYLLFVDLLKIYQSYYLLVTVMLEKFEEMDLKDSKRAFIIYLNFIKVNREIRKMAAVIVQEFNIKLKLHFYDIDTKVVDALKQSIELRERKLKKGGSSSQEGADSSSDNSKSKPKRSHNRSKQASYSQNLTQRDQQSIQNLKTDQDYSRAAETQREIQPRSGKEEHIAAEAEGAKKKQRKLSNYQIEMQGNQGGQQMTIPIFEGDQNANFSNAMRQATQELGTFKSSKKIQQILQGISQSSEIANNQHQLLSRQTQFQPEASGFNAIQEQMITQPSPDLVKRSYTLTMDRLQRERFQQQQQLNQENYIKRLNQLQQSQGFAQMHQASRLQSYATALENIQEEAEGAREFGEGMNIQKFSEFADELLLEYSPKHNQFEKIGRRSQLTASSLNKFAEASIAKNSENLLRLNSQGLQKQFQEQQDLELNHQSSNQSQKRASRGNQQEQEQTFGLSIGKTLSSQKRPSVNGFNPTEAAYQSTPTLNSPKVFDSDDEDAFKTVLEEDPRLANFRSANEDRYANMFQTAQSSQAPSSLNFQSAVSQTPKQRTQIPNFKENFKRAVAEDRNEGQTKILQKVQSELFPARSQLQSGLFPKQTLEFDEDQSSINKASKESFFVEADSFILQKSSRRSQVDGYAMQPSQSARNLDHDKGNKLEQLAKDNLKDLGQQSFQKYGLKVMAGETQSYNPRQSQIEGYLSSVNSGSHDLSANIFSQELNHNLNLQSSSTFYPSANNEKRNSDNLYFYQNRKASYSDSVAEDDEEDQFEDAQEDVKRFDRLQDLKVDLGSSRSLATAAPTSRSVFYKQTTTSQQFNQRREFRPQEVNESFQSCVDSEDYQ